MSKNKKHNDNKSLEKEIKNDKSKKKINKKFLGIVLTLVLVVSCICCIRYDEQNKKREYAIKYVESSGASKQRTYEHMQNEGLDSDLIQYAMENVDVDWNQNVLICAKDLIEMGAVENEEELSNHLSDSLYEENEIQYAIDNLTKKDWEIANKEHQEDDGEEEVYDEYEEYEEYEEKEMTTEEKLEVAADISGLEEGTDYKIECDKNTIFFLIYAQNGVDESMKSEARKLSLKFKSLSEDNTKIIVSYVDGQKIIYSAFDGKDL